MKFLSIDAIVDGATFKRRALPCGHKFLSNSFAVAQIEIGQANGELINPSAQAALSPIVIHHGKAVGDEDRNAGGARRKTTENAGARKLRVYNLNPPLAELFRGATNGEHILMNARAPVGISCMRNAHDKTVAHEASGAIEVDVFHQDQIGLKARAVMVADEFKKLALGASVSKGTNDVSDLDFRKRHGSSLFRRGFSGADCE